MSAILFEDIFQVNDVNPDGKKFERVTRLMATGESYEMEMLLDVNSEVYPISGKGGRYSCALASTLSLDGSPDSGEFNQSGQPSLLDNYEYGMYGKLFKCMDHDPDESGNPKISVYLSFGGLLMSLTGDQRQLSRLHQNARLYLLMRKA